MELASITDLIFTNGILLFKIPILILLLVYVIFTFIVVNRIRAFNRILHIASAHASVTIQIVAIIQFLLALSLFLLALVIV
ncbi:MAG: DUF5657 family protein [Patescibacteria group bacterium]